MSDVGGAGALAFTMPVKLPGAAQYARAIHRVCAVHCKLTIECDMAAVKTHVAHTLELSPRTRRERTRVLGLRCDVRARSAAGKTVAVTTRAMSGSSARVAVVGVGVAGAFCAHALRTAGGAQVTLFDRATRGPGERSHLAFRAGECRAARLGRCI